jgi:hypothetical protein
MSNIILGVVNIGSLQENIFWLLSSNSSVYMAIKYAQSISSFYLQDLLFVNLLLSWI